MLIGCTKKLLEAADIIPEKASIHSLLIKQSGGLDGLRDSNLLESALKAPFQTFA